MRKLVLQRPSLRFYPPWVSVVALGEADGLCVRQSDAVHGGLRVACVQAFQYAFAARLNRHHRLHLLGCAPFESLNCEQMGEALYEL